MRGYNIVDVQYLRVIVEVGFIAWIGRIVRIVNNAAHLADDLFELLIEQRDRHNIVHIGQQVLNKIISR